MVEIEEIDQVKKVPVLRVPNEKVELDPVLVVPVDPLGAVRVVQVQVEAHPQALIPQDQGRGVKKVILILVHA